MYVMNGSTECLRLLPVSTVDSDDHYASLSAACSLTLSTGYQYAKCLQDAGSASRQGMLLT